MEQITEQQNERQIVAVEKRIIERATEYARGLIGDENYEDLATMTSCLSTFFEKKEGKAFIKAAERCASKVGSLKALMNMAKYFYHKAKEWASASPMRMFCIFVLSIAAIITFMLILANVPECVVFEWAGNLLTMLTDRLCSLVGRTFTEKIGQFFAGNSME